MKKNKYPKCKSCQYWKKEQAEIGYAKHQGFCTSPKHKFNTTQVGDICVLDRNNISIKAWNNVQRFESQNDIVPIGNRNISRYCLVTEEEYGCINHVEKQ